MDRSRIAIVQLIQKSKEVFIPENIHELLDERIQFCESVLNNRNKIPASSQTESMIGKFDSELKIFRRIKDLLNALTDGDTDNIEEIRTQFYIEASEMMNKLISHCREQLDNVSDLLTIHLMLNLIEALNKINQQIGNI